MNEPEQQLAGLVVDRVLHQRLADALDHAAVDLARDQHRVQHHAEVVDRGVADDLGRRRSRGRSRPRRCGSRWGRSRRRSWPSPRRRGRPRRPRAGSCVRALAASSSSADRCGRCRPPGTRPPRARTRCRRPRSRAPARRVLAALDHDVGGVADRHALGGQRARAAGAAAHLSLAVSPWTTRIFSNGTPSRSFRTWA